VRADGSRLASLWRVLPRAETRPRVFIRRAPATPSPLSLSKFLSGKLLTLSRRKSHSQTIPVILNIRLFVPSATPPPPNPPCPTLQKWCALWRLLKHPPTPRLGQLMEGRSLKVCWKCANVDLFTLFENSRNLNFGAVSDVNKSALLFVGTCRLAPSSRPAPIGLHLLLPTH